jgi:hypothetical protein
MEVYGVNFEGAFWTTDCAGKQDFDFNILSVSTRYWPDHTARPQILLGDRVLVQLPKQEYIEGTTELECKQKVEQWVREKISIIMTQLEELKGE